MLDELRACTDKYHLANLIGVKLKFITYHVNVVSEADRYHEFTVPKKHGGERIISAPNVNLKFIQKRLSEILQSCLDELDDSGGAGRRRLSFGFKPTLSPFDNAKCHTGRRWVLNFDISDFFWKYKFWQGARFLYKAPSFLA